MADFGFDWGEYATAPDFAGGFDPNYVGGGTYWTPGYDLTDPTASGTIGGGGAGACGGSGVDNENAGNLTEPNLWAGAGGGAGGGKSIADIMKGIPWSTLLPIIATLGGGLYAQNRTSKATEQMQQAIAKANEQVAGILGGNQALYAPYQRAGVEGLNRLTNFPQSTLASRYRPLGTGAGMTLGALTGGRITVNG